ncbi:hypothetical protein GCM10009535_26310 [Streptomyces thermocarboxydovorans]|uniref:Uncharacterized protein n=1 Tax=Streptomyces thermocarboxydovorans TaxID=59298 RepID=A0ABN1HGK0_9ACTN
MAGEAEARSPSRPSLPAPPPPDALWQPVSAITSAQTAPTELLTCIASPPDTPSSVTRQNEPRQTYGVVCAP